jgi:predicted nucleotidyltransferase
MLDALRGILETEPGVAYALVFGSLARGTARPDSDVDVALELFPGAPRDARAIGALAARLTAAAGREAHVVLLDEAPSPLAYRIFRDGHVLLERDRAALVSRKARTVLEYLDFKPIEERCAAGVLRAAASRGR